MRFHHKKGIKKQQNKWLNALLTIVAIACLAGGVYLLILVVSPNVPVFYPVEPIDVKTLPQASGDRIYIPKVGVNVELAVGGPEALEKGAWHRFPERGDPVQGGNFIVSAHRFEIGYTPGETRRKSPFYHIDKLAIGDQIIVDYKGKRYGYEVTEHREVRPDQIEIEEQTKDARLTLYSCTLKGEADGREVYFAKPLGEVVDGKVAR